MLEFLSFAATLMVTIWAAVGFLISLFFMPWPYWLLYFGGVLLFGSVARLRYQRVKNNRTTSGGDCSRSFQVRPLVGLWIPSLSAARILRAFGWLVFASLLLGALLLERQLVVLPEPTFVLGLLAALVLCWPAASIVAGRSEAMASMRLSFLRGLWQAIFAGVPPQLAFMALALFVGLAVWTQTAVEHFMVGLFASPSAVALLATVVIHGHVLLDGKQGTSNKRMETDV